MVKIHFITQGCSANVADTEVMAGLLKEEGFEIVDDFLNADLIVFNTCTVKGPTESFFKKKLKQFRDLKKRIVLAGCIPQAEKNLEQFNDCSIIGTYQIHNIVDVVEETLNGNNVVLIARENKSRLNLPKVRKNDYIEIVPASHGCLGSCTFCKTKFARGNLFSYPSKDIVRHISKAVKEGVNEIWLTSQDMSAYGKDIETNLPKLIKDIVSIPGYFKIRVGMANPDYILDFLDELIWAFKEEKVYKFLHIPIQSGSNKVIKEMNRNYSVEDFKYIVKRFREEIPEITIATDVICGYPTEKKEDFEETIKLIKEIRPDVINISKFWARPGTIAVGLKQISGAEIKKRSARLTRLFHKIAKENNEKWIGWKGKAFFTEEGKEGSFIGRNSSYRQIVVKTQEFILGEEKEVEVVDCSSFDLKARLLE